MITMMTLRHRDLLCFIYPYEDAHTHALHVYSAHIHKSIHTQHNIHKEGEIRVHSGIVIFQLH